jgi:hypothetical protein
MSFTLMIIGAIIFIVGLPWLAAAVGLVLVGLHAGARGIAALAGAAMRHSATRTRFS